MESIICVGVNIPCAALGLMINLFYVFCLNFSLGRTMNIRQPLSSLLVLMIFCTDLFQVSPILHLSLDISNATWNLKHAVNASMFYAVRVSFPTTLWLNIFYCTQIVPGRTTSFMWLKRNIRPIVYLFTIFTKIYFLVYYILEFILVYDLPSDIFEVNSTIESNTGIVIGSRIQLDQFLDTLDAVTMGLVFLGLVWNWKCPASWNVITSSSECALKYMKRLNICQFTSPRWKKCPQKKFFFKEIKTIKEAIHTSVLLFYPFKTIRLCEHFSEAKSCTDKYNVCITADKLQW